MGVAYGDLKKVKNKNNSKNIIESKETKKSNTKRKITVNFSSKIINKFQEDNDKTDNKIQSKTEKILENSKKIDENNYKDYYSGKKKIRSLSVEKFSRIEGSYNYLEIINHDEIYPNSLDNNSSSKQSNKEIKNELLSKEINHNKESIDYDDEDEDGDSEGEKEEEMNNQNYKEINKINNSIITKNMKIIFIDSKKLDKYHKDNNNNTEDENSTNIDSRTSSLTALDYELNFYKSRNEIRQSYISKLIAMKVMNPNMKPKQHNSIIIFDWDDTLLPTSFLTPGGVYNEEMVLSDECKGKFEKIEQLVFLILNDALEKGNVYIITNSGKGWVEYSAKK